MDKRETIYIPSDVGSTKEIQNVTKIEFVEWGKTSPAGVDVSGGHFGWLVETNSPSLVSDHTNKPVYYALDCNNHFAFAHWIYESFVFLTEYQLLKKTYPTLKLLIVEWKDYKRIGIEYYGISLEDVVLYSDIKSEQGNLCFLHEYMSLNNNLIPQTFYPAFESFLDKVDSVSKHKTIPILYLPRGTKENFGPNDRRYDIQPQLEEFVSQAGGFVYKTDKTTNFLEQIQMVRRAKIILLDYGSSLWVNGMVANGSAIVYMTVGWRHHEQFPGYGFLWQKIRQRNMLEGIPASGGSKDANGMDICHFSLHHVLHTIQKYLNIDSQSNN